MTSKKIDRRRARSTGRAGLKKKIGDALPVKGNVQKQENEEAENPQNFRPYINEEFRKYELEMEKKWEESNKRSAAIWASAYEELRAIVGDDFKFQFPKK